MLFLIVADKQSFRHTQIARVLESAPESEMMVYDDTYGTVADLEQFLYPSLFSTAPPIIHLKFILSSDTETVTTSFLKKLLASPTVFIFEEMTLAAPVVALFKKTGAIVHAADKTPSIKKEGDIFAVTACITATDKKARWIAYRNALDSHSIEAIVGILYWKVRDLSLKNSKEKDRYLSLYKKLLSAHARAWESGAPLELMIEKVILTQQ